jgi:N-methylhydantoinase A
MGLSVIARGQAKTPRLPARMPPAPPRPATTRRAWLPGEGWQEIPVLDRAALAARLVGPAIIQEYDATCLIPTGASAEIDAFGAIIVTL